MAPPGEGGLSVWQGADIVVGVTVSWIPLVADYTRYSRVAASAFWGVGLGYWIADAWLLVARCGARALARTSSDAAALPAAVVAGGLVAVLALLALTVAETDDAFANAYSGAVSVQNLAPRVPQRLLVVATTGARRARGAVDRPRLVPVVPAAARLVLRAAVRSPARRLARGVPLVHPGRRSSVGLRGVPD